VAANLGLAAWLGAIAAALTVGVCGMIAVGIVFAEHARARARRAGDLLPRVLAATGMGALSAAALASLVLGAGDATTEDLVRLVAIRGGACVAIAGAAILVARERLAIGRNLARLGRLLADEGDRPTAESLLREAVGDPGLSVGYWTDERGYVGADGRALRATDPGRQRTELTSRGRPIAIVLHDPHALPPELVETSIGPEARLAIQNESLALELERRLDQVRASRRRVVEAGDAERRQLERDLHDGAQQLLLALSFEVRRGERSAAEAGDEVAAARFAEVRAVAARILEQLRVLAHGIHPTILTTGGLAPALTTYAGALGSPPAMTVEVPRRLLPSAEASAYAIVTALVAAAPDDSAVSYAIRDDGGTLRIVVDGELRVPDHVLDRVSAAGGSWAAGPTGVEFVLPCA
jgi:signal transduction histidine kinase